MPGVNRAARASAIQSIAHPSVADYTRLGYPAFPCGSNKQPLTPHGLKDATTDTDTITAWWQRWPTANVAILPPTDVLVLDCDTAKAANRLARAYGLSACPHLKVPCSQVLTPRGGCHFYLRLPDGAPHVPTRTAALPDVDIRGMGRAYLLAPPSRTADGVYRWLRPLVRPDGLPIIPNALLVRLTLQKRRADLKVPCSQSRFKAPRKTFEGKDTRHFSAYARAALQAEYDRVASALEGTRNGTLNRAAFSLGQLVGAGMLERCEVEEALMAAAMTCGLPDGEALGTIHSGLEAGMKEPRCLPEGKPLSLASRRIARWRADASDAKSTTRYAPIGKKKDEVRHGTE